MKIKAIQGREQSRPSGVRWGAIIAGAFIALGVVMTFSMMGGALGMGGVNVLMPTPDITVGEAVYGIIITALGLFVGGYATSRIGRITSGVSAVLHGVTAWAVGATLLGLAAAFFTSLFIFASTGLLWTLTFSLVVGAAASAAGAVMGVQRVAAEEAGEEAVPVHRREEERVSPRTAA